MIIICDMYRLCEYLKYSLTTKVIIILNKFKNLKHGKVIQLIVYLLLFYFQLREIAFSVF